MMNTRRLVPAADCLMRSQVWRDSGSQLERWGPGSATCHFSGPCHDPALECSPLQVGRAARSHQLLAFRGSRHIGPPGCGTLLLRKKLYSSFLLLRVGRLGPRPSGGRKHGMQSTGAFPGWRRPGENEPHTCGRIRPA